MTQLTAQPAAMVVLPPPAKERKRPSKPNPPTISLPSRTSTAAPSSISESAAVFDPFFNAESKCQKGRLTFGICMGLKHDYKACMSY